jgi:transaldolase/glucose-6-phosphate isomerase
MALDHDLGDLEPRLRQRLAAMRSENVVARIWGRDHTLWRPDPTEIIDRLGWLDAPERSRGRLGEVRTIAEEAAADGLTHAVLLGMGGSSLAPEVYRKAFGVAEGMLDLAVLDTTHPDAVVALERSVPLDRTLFVVSSKSGTTIETRSHLAYFHELVRDGSRFVAITDPGTPLEEVARDLGFRAVIQAAPDVGGRYSALIEFGLVPAALIGADVDGLLDEAARAAEACREEDPERNPGALLGAVLGEAALAGRDKCTFRAEGELRALGAWLEQLLAESTGKEGKGIVPVNGEEPAAARSGDDRLFLSLGNDSPSPSVVMPYRNAQQLGHAFFVLEFATAVAGHVLGIHPFDQPDVQAAKDRTAQVLDAGVIPDEPMTDLDELLSTVRPGDYVSIQAFVPPSPDIDSALQEARLRIGDRLGVATTLGYGPRYLHSTGQLHKGGPGTGVFLQLFQEPVQDREIPGQPFTFGRLIAAQAAGDLAALRDRGRRAGRVALHDLLAWGR